MIARIRTFKPLAAALAFLLVTFVAYLAARPQMYFAFPPYDDEGYMLTVLHSFLAHGHLYDDVFSQYGPFYYEAWGGLFSGFGIAVDHDAGRAATLAVWVLASLLAGLATARMTGSYLLGLATQMVAFATLESLVSEPMHPGGLICLLLAAILAIACLVRERASVGAIAALGGAIAALALVKVNVGGFAIVALALVCTLSYAPLRRRRWPRPLAEVAFVALPVALMSAKLGEDWARHYAFHVAVAALAVVIALRAREAPRRPPEELWWLLGGLVAVAAVCCLAILAAGTSPGGLVEGLIGQPLRQADAFSLPFPIGDGAYVFDALALCLAVAFWWLSRSPRSSSGWTVAVSAIAVLVGVELALSPIGKTLPVGSSGIAGYQLALLPFAWVALVPPPGEGRPATAFACLFLPPLAVLEALHAYPVAGSQVEWSAFLLAPVGALCVANGVRGLAHGIGALAAIALLAYVANTTLREPLNEARAAYDARVPLDLPGANDVRLYPTEAQLYRRVTRAIEENCASFVMLPGMDSFYLWTKQEPPSGYNATGWTTLFDAAHQERVIREIDPDPELCLLENEPLAAAWSGGTIPDGPLVEYMRREFQPLLSIGDYRLLKRPPRAEPTS